MEIPVWQLGITDDMILGRPILTTEEGYNAGIVFYRAENGMLKVTMPSCSGAVFVSRPEEFYPVMESRFAGEDGDRVTETANE